MHTSVSIPVILAAATLALPTTSAGAAVLLADFSSGTNPVQSWGVSTLSTGIPPVAGSGNWADVTVEQYWGKLTIPGWATSDLTIARINSNSAVEFDLIFPSSGWLPGHANIELSFELNGSSALPTVHSLGWTTPDISSSKDQSLHFSINYGSLGALPDTSDINLHLHINPGYDWMWDGTNNSGATAYTNQRFYIDNIALTSVPEPAVTLLALSGGMAGLRRRR